MFHVLPSHTWPMAILLNSTALEPSISRGLCLPLQELHPGEIIKEE